jgi:hypothetical protein
VFSESGGHWSEQAELTAADGAAQDELGSSVSLSGRLAVVGAPGRTVGSHAGQGAAYVFAYSGGRWSQQAELTAFNGAVDSYLGTSASLSGGTALVGASGGCSFSTCSGGKVQGSAYVFAYSGGRWSQQAELTASDGAPGDWFGEAVSLSGTTALIGAPEHSAGWEGAAYVFGSSAGTWSQQGEITGTDSVADDEFGWSVSLSGTTALIGAHLHDVGSNYSQGSAYVFAESAGTWSQQAELLASDGALDNELGSSVSLSGPVALVGAEARGAAYVFGTPEVVVTTTTGLSATTVAPTTTTVTTGVPSTTAALSPTTTSQAPITTTARPPSTTAPASTTTSTRTVTTTARSTTTTAVASTTTTTPGPAAPAGAVAWWAWLLVGLAVLTGLGLIARMLWRHRRP